MSETTALPDDATASPTRWPAALEVGIIAAYGAVFLRLGVDLALRVTGSQLSVIAVAGCFTIGAVSLASLFFRSFDVPVYLASLAHSAVAIVATPLWLRRALLPGGDPQLSLYFIAANLMLPLAVAYLLHCAEPRGKRITALLKTRSRLTWGDRLLVLFGLLFAFALVYIGGRTGQLLFAVFVLGPAIGLVLLIRFFVDRVRGIGGKDRDYPIVARRIKLRSQMTRPGQTRHQWTVSTQPTPGDDEY